MLRMVVMVGVSTCLLCATPTFSNDDMVRQMEIDIKIQELDRAVREHAHKMAWASIRKTSLWFNYDAARKALEPSADCIRFGTELDRRGTGRSFKESIELLDKRRTACALDVELSMTSAYRNLSREVSALMDRIRVLHRKFKARIYATEMKRRLKGLALDVPEDALKKIQRYYRKWEA